MSPLDESSWESRNEFRGSGPLPPTDAMVYGLRVDTRRTWIDMRGLLLSALSLTLLLAACDAVNRDTDAERQILAEQKAIVAYSKSVPAADLQQTQFSRAWSAANEIKTMKAFRESMRDKVIPSLNDHVKSLQEMPTGSAELEKIHGAMVASWSEVVIAFNVFLDGLNEDNVESKYRTLLEAMDKVGEAEKAYHASLREYYARSRVKLVDSKKP